LESFERDSLAAIRDGSAGLVSFLGTIVELAADCLDFLLVLFNRLYVFFGVVVETGLTLVLVLRLLLLEELVEFGEH